MATNCFACQAGPCSDGRPRMLCLRHKDACELPDGSVLSDVLTLVEPSGSQLEGSSLGWLYNPVFVVDDHGNRRRGWTSFVGGGMAVLEDRFGAADPFEFWICEREDMVNLLTIIGRLGTADEVRTPVDKLPATSRDLFEQARDMWLWHRQVSQRHSALGRWPESFEELSDLLAFPAEAEAVEPTELGLLWEQLTELARRRSSIP